MDPNSTFLTNPFQVFDITRFNLQGPDNNGSNLSNTFIANPFQVSDITRYNLRSPNYNGSNPNNTLLTNPFQVPYITCINSQGPDNNASNPNRTLLINPFQVSNNTTRNNHQGPDKNGSNPNNNTLLTKPFQVSDITTRKNPQGPNNNGSNNLKLDKPKKRRASRARKAMEKAEKEAPLDAKGYTCPRCKETSRTVYSYVYHLTRTHQIEDQKEEKKKFVEAKAHRLEEDRIRREQHKIIQKQIQKQKQAEARRLKKAAAAGPSHRNKPPLPPPIPKRPVMLRTIRRGALYIKGVRQNAMSYNYTGGLPFANIAYPRPPTSENYGKAI